MKKGLLFQPDRCLGCHVCEVACLDAHDLPASAPLLWVETREQGSGDSLRVQQLLHRCLQCEHPLCVESCPTGALVPVEGMPRVNETLCVGCGACAAACPSQSIRLFEGKAHKCDLCQSLGESPRCVRACLSYGALTFNNF